MFVYAGPIFARASADGLDYAITGDFNLVVPYPGSYTLDLTSGKAHHPKFHWGWGFVVGLGGYLPYDGWDLTTEWKRFHGKASGHLTIPCDKKPKNLSESSYENQQNKPKTQVNKQMAFITEFTLIR